MFQLLLNIKNSSHFFGAGLQVSILTSSKQVFTGTLWKGSNIDIVERMKENYKSVYSQKKPSCNRMNLIPNREMLFS